MNPAAWSVTFLDKNACKLDRRFFGHVGSGCHQVRRRHRYARHRGGIESTLSGMVMGFAPAWCVGSASAIARFPMIAGITTLHIFGERGDGGANARAIKQLKQRWKHSGADIYVINPTIGNDLNDALCAR